MASAVTLPQLMQDIADENSNDFWVAQLVGAYEGRLDEDLDDEDVVVTGFAYQNTNIAYVFHEAIRDTAANMPGAVDAARLEKRTALHETGHLFGLDDVPPVTVMNADPTVFHGADGDNKFTNSELGRIQAQPKPNGIGGS